VSEDQTPDGAQLVSEVESFLASVAEVYPTATDAIRHDRFDAQMFEELLGEVPALSDVAEELGEHHGHTGDLLRDLYHLLYKNYPERRDRDQMHPRWRTNHTVVGNLSETSEIEALRQHSIHDEYGAVMGLLGMRPAIEDALTQAAEAEERAEEVERAQAEAAAQAQALAEQLDQAQQQAGEDGSLPEDAAQQLAQAMADAQQAAATAQAAGELLDDANDALKAKTAKSLREAAEQATKDLDEQAEAMRSWGIGDGELQKLDFRQRQQLAKQLQSDKLRKFSELIGRMRTLAQAERARKVVHGVDELHDIVTGNDLGLVLPSELLLLADDDLEIEFLRRFAESSLLQGQLRGEERIGKGAIVVVLDCSGSMGGGISWQMREPSREAWGKALSLALLDQARTAKRDFACVLFSSRNQIQTFLFRAGASTISDRIALAEHFWGGGTDFEAPLDVASGLLEREFSGTGRQHGDIVFVTDGEAPISPTFLRRWHERKDRSGFRCFGVAVATDVTPEIAAVSDNTRTVVDLIDVESTTGDLFRTI